MTSFASTLHLSNNVKSIKSLRGDIRFSRNGKCFPIAPDQCGQYANTGCGVLRSGGTKLECFLPKNQHTQRKLLNWVNGEMSKSAKTCQNLTFNVNFLFKISS